ncbi:hypothetical protein BH10PSE12_BH10PSE12_30440 [soil metagenome]
MKILGRRGFVYVLAARHDKEKSVGTVCPAMT